MSPTGERMSRFVLCLSFSPASPVWSGWLNPVSAERSSFIVYCFAMCVTSAALAAFRPSRAMMVALTTLYHCMRWSAFCQPPRYQGAKRQPSFAMIRTRKERENKMCVIYYNLFIIIYLFNYPVFMEKEKLFVSPCSSFLLIYSILFCISKKNEKKMYYCKKKILLLCAF